MVPEWIQAACERVGEALQARSVSVFGSFATDDTSRHSDLDLLIVSSAMAGVHPLERIEQALKALGTLPVGADVIVLTPEELEARAHSRFMKRIRSEAKTVYESH